MPIVHAPYDETSHRLALGLELVDAALDARVARPVSVAFDGVPLPRSRSRDSYSTFGFEITDTLPRVDRHDSCLHALVYRKGLYVAGKRTSVELRFSCPSRHHVPRRLRFLLVDPSLPEPPVPDPDQATLDASRAARWRKVALFPGAAYDTGGAPTGLRGRVRRGGIPLRWARIEARPRLRGGGLGSVIGRAHGDDRGEFLLILGAIPGSVLTSLTVDVEVAVFGWAADPPATDSERTHDPLWDLPMEAAIAPPPADAVSLGVYKLPDYTAMPPRVVTFRLGKILSSEVSPFTF